MLVSENGTIYFAYIICSDFRDKMNKIPVIDIFAGPGGLSEGFHRYSWFANDKDTQFDIRLSIEKDEHAHKTLLLRSFVRQFQEGGLPEEYYLYVQSQTEKDKAKNLKFLQSMIQWKNAEEEAWQTELGKTDFKTLHEKIRRKVGNNKNWVLLGGPPCQAYSVIGRSRRLGSGDGKIANDGAEHIEKEEVFFKDEKHTLYLEYLEIVALHQPAVFVMENVKGILSSKVNSVLEGKREPLFPQILKDLASPSTALRTEKLPPNWTDFRPDEYKGYKLFSCVVSSENEEMSGPKDFLVSAKRHGIPQLRQRVIVLGVRDDLCVSPGTIPALKTEVSLKEVIGDLPALRSGRSGKLESGRGFGDRTDTEEKWLQAIKKFTTEELLNEINSIDVSEIINVVRSQPFAPGTRGAPYISSNRIGSSLPERLKPWFVDNRLGGVLNHESRAHMDSDLARYLFVAAYGEVFGSSPKMNHFPEKLLPQHRNARKSWKSTSGVFNDRFRVQVADLPSTTITAHMCKDGHYFIHYDPKQCRSLTVREAARVQTFPDNYYFEGSKTRQYQQVGNAVPPFLAVQIAKVVAKVIQGLDGKIELENSSLQEAV